MSSIVFDLDHARVLKRSETGKPNRADVESAFRTIIRWTGDDPERDGLIDTPARVGLAFEEYFAGYDQDPALILQKTFEIVECRHDRGDPQSARGRRHHQGDASLHEHAGRAST